MENLVVKPGKKTAVDKRLLRQREVALCLIVPNGNWEQA